jgi:hypothetical protein
METKTWNVNIDYPSECMQVEARTKEEAEDKALEMLGIVEFNAVKECTAEAEEIK